MSPEKLDFPYEFGPFRLEPATRRLLREGEPLPLTPKAFDTLLLLVQNNERVVEKEEVLRRVWPDAVVEESNLAQNVFTLRKALGDTPEGARFIATVPRRGYRFVAPVVRPRKMPDPAAEPAREPPNVRARPRARTLALLVAAFLAAALLPLAGYLAAGRGADPGQPRFMRLTFRRGVVRAARFAPDGRSVVYSASWDGQPTALFLSRPDSPESLSLGTPSADVLAVSSSGELALALRPNPLYSAMGEFQTLARTSMTGGVPREVLENVEWADWSPDGKSLAVVRKVDNRVLRLEYPIGRVLVETSASQCLDRVRVSRDGRLAAFIACAPPDHAVPGNKAPFSVSVVDAEGRQRSLWQGTDWVGGLAWSPRGDEVWFTTETRFHLPQARAVDLSGRSRVLGPLPGAILDVSRHGGLLVMLGRHSSGIRGRSEGEPEERELSWLEGSAVADLSPDGRRVLFGELMDGGGFSGRIYLRDTDGSPAVHLGDGHPLALSPDGSRAAVRLEGREGLTLLPTGAGEPRTLAMPGLGLYLARWFADGRRLLVGAMSGRREGRLYVLDGDGGSLRPITPEATGVGAVSPDGKWVATIGHDGHFLYPVEGGQRRPLPGLDLEEWPVQWTADGRGLYLRREGRLPSPVLLLDLETGRKELWKELAPPDRAGVVSVEPLPAPDGRSYVYTYQRLLSDLYYVDGLE